MDHVPWMAAMFCYIQIAILLTFGYIREFFGSVSGYSRYKSAPTKPGFAKLLLSWEKFYTNRIYHRTQDVFNRPVANAPGAHIDVIERYSKDGNRTLQRKDGCVRACLNLGSYNYLGFADDWINICSEDVFKAVTRFGLASLSSTMEFGTTTIHRELEEEFAKFIGKPAALVYNMGFATNATTIPALMSKGSLIISDSLNHSSIINGARASGAHVVVFRHNDAEHLEHTLRMNIARGQPRTNRAWKKVMVMVEGIYSMEGEIVHLRNIVDVVKKYKAYIYVDEAHSIGALGRTGRGICEYAGVDPSEIDILMGTFTKSFAGMGGYVAASEEIISYIRTSSAGSMYAASLSPVVAQQILTSLRVIMGTDGSDYGKKKLDNLRENSNYFRQQLINMVLERNLAVVTVGFPATPLLLSRVRFCISAAHTKEDLDKALKQIEEVSSNCNIQFLKS
ncbi:hypothetical protein ABG067_006417 [Albugo candida]